MQVGKFVNVRITVMAIVAASVFAALTLRAQEAWNGRQNRLNEGPLRGATFPQKKGTEMSEESFLNFSFNFMEELHINFIRLKPWDNWTTGQLERFLELADQHAIQVAVVLSHRYNPFIRGYPDDVQTSLQDLADLWEIFDRHPSVWGFDVRAEPFKRQLGFNENAEVTWMQTIAGAIKQHDARYRVFANLMESTPEKIPLVSPFSDYIAINYYFPRGGDLDGAYKGREVPPEVYEREMPGYIDAFMRKVESYNVEEKPVIIAQFGAHHGPRADKPYTTAEGQATWYRVFFESMKKYTDTVQGYFFFLLGAADQGFSIIDANLQCKPACAEIGRAYGAWAAGAVPQDSLITRHFFGFDFWSRDINFWQAVLAQLQQDSLAFGLVGTDAIRWEKIEPDPPTNGVHAYDWSAVDPVMALMAQSGLDLEISLLTVSPWAAVVAPEDLVGAPCCRMSPLKSDAESDTSAWGMTAAQAWYDFVYHLIERYDGDGVDDAPGVDRRVIRHIMYGNEPDTYDHFFANGGTVQEYWRGLRLLYEAVKAADPKLVVLRGKMNPGNTFDDNPDLETARQRDQHGSIDSLRAALALGGDYFDVFAINFNSHYTGLKPLVGFLTQEMRQHGYDRPFVISDARTTLYPRDNSGPDHILPPRYPPGYLAVLDDPNQPDYPALKKTVQADEVRQSIRKIMAALETGQHTISLQPVYSPLNIDWAAGDRKAMWLYSGFFDPYLYETTGDLALAREPLYYAMKQLTAALVGASRQVERLDPGDEFIYVYRLKKDGQPFVIAWHENPWDVDATGLVRRGQRVTVDLQGVLPGEELRLRHFVVALDDRLAPIYPPDEVVPARQVVLDETPVLIESARVTGVAEASTVRPDRWVLHQNYPNPFNPATTIRFTLPQAGHVTLKVFDVLGREVATLVDEKLAAGDHAVVFEASDLSNGVYFYRLTAGAFTQIRKAVLIK